MGSASTRSSTAASARWLMKISPSLAAAPRREGRLATRPLAAYRERLQEQSLSAERFDPRAAAAMLLGTLFADAIGRDIVPDMYAVPTEEALTQYVTLFLRGIGVETSTPRSSA